MEDLRSSVPLFRRQLEHELGELVSHRCKPCRVGRAQDRRGELVESGLGVDTCCVKGASVGARLEFSEERAHKKVSRRARGRGELGLVVVSAGDQAEQ